MRNTYRHICCIASAELRIIEGMAGALSGSVSVACSKRPRPRGQAGSERAPSSKDRVVWVRGHQAIGSELPVRVKWLASFEACAGNKRIYCPPRLSGVHVVMVERLIGEARQAA